MSKNIFEALRKDHESQRTLINMLTDTSGDTKGREKIFKRLKNEVTAHAAAEERYFYRPLMEHDNTMDKSRHSVAEHKEIEDIIEELEKTDMSSAGWLVTAKKLEERLIHHLDEEEQEVFKSAGHALKEKEKQDFGEHFIEEKERLLD